MVDGVLLITPESLCFDACQTAIAQKEAYLKSHVQNKPDDSKQDVVDTTESNFGEVSCELSCCEIPKALLNLGVYISLKSIMSLSTLREDNSPDFEVK